MLSRMMMREVIDTMTVQEEEIMVAMGIVPTGGHLALCTVGVQVLTMVDPAAQHTTGTMALLMKGAEVLIMVGTSVLNMADIAGL